MQDLGIWRRAGSLEPVGDTGQPRERADAGHAIRFDSVLAEIGSDRCDDAVLLLHSTRLGQKELLVIITQTLRGKFETRTERKFINIYALKVIPGVWMGGRLQLFIINPWCP